MTPATRQLTDALTPSIPTAVVAGALVIVPLVVLAFGLFAPVSAAAGSTPRPLIDSASPDPALDPRGADLFRMNADEAALAPIRPSSHPDDARWFDGFALPDVDGRVMDFAEFEGELIVAGFFRQIGGRAVNYIARWNGSEWSPVGTGMDGPVRTLEAIDDELYVGGYFTTAGGVAAEGLAVWNGSAWSAVGSGLHGSVNSIVAHLDGIAVAGDLLVGASAVNVAQWNGSEWAPLLTGLDDAVYDLAIFNGQLAAGGAFRLHNGAPLNHVAIFDGALWRSPGGGVTAAQIDPSLVSVMALSVHDSKLWAAGAFDHAGSTETRNIAAWNGGAWVDAGALYGFARGLRVVGSTLYAFGSLWEDSTSPGLVVGARHWTGSEWERPIQYPREPVHAMGGWRDSLVLSGTAIIPHEDVMILRGAGWTSLRAPWRAKDRGFVGRSHGAAVRALQPLGDRLFVGGDFSGAGAENGLTYTPGFAHSLRDPYSWRIEPLATDFNGWVNTFATYQSTVVAGGLFDGAPTNATTERFVNIARWDGTGWQRMGSLNGEVFALAVYRGALYAGGNFTSADGDAVSGLARWNGARWVAVGGATADPAVIYSLVADGDSLWIGGSFKRMGGAVATNIARWDGTVFHALGFGVRTVSQGGYVTTMARHDGRLVVGGLFDRAGLLEAPQLAQWNGLDWEPFGTQTWGGSFMVLKTARDTLWAGGQFHEVGGTPMNLAWWNGAAWVVPGSGPEGMVHALTFVGDTLYAGGAFTVAGGKASYRLARWDPSARGGGPTPPAAGTTVESLPNPMAGSATLVFALPAGTGYELAIHDLTGRKVLSRHETTSTAGTQQVTWDGRGDDGGLVPAGLYFVRVVSGGAEHARGRIAVVR